MPEPKNWGRPTEKRLGVMLHYDGSTSDAGAVQWLTADPRCHVSYNWLVKDNGEVVEVAPPAARAWHAGICKPSSEQPKYRDANSAFYGVSLAVDGDDVVTPEAKDALVTLVRGIFETHGWPLKETWRIVGHSSEAWPRRRKIDPEGPKKWRPVLSVQEIRDRVREAAHV